MSDSYNDHDVLSKIKVGLSRGLRVVNIRSKEAYDSLLIKNKIQKHKRKFKNNSNQLGERVYLMFKNRNEFNLDEIKNKCVDIAKIDQEIKDFEEELKLIHLNAKKELGNLKAITKPGE